MRDVFSFRFDERGVADFERQGSRSHRVRVRPIGGFIAGQTHGALRPVAADLLDLAIAVHAADRLCPRRQGSWSRLIRVSVPVRDHGLWSAKVVACLEELLGFLSQDEWSIDVRPGDALAFGDSQAAFDVPNPVRAVGLYSAGLDSLAGVAAVLSETPAREFALAACGTNSRLAAKQAEQLREIGRRTGDQLAYVRVPFRLSNAHGLPTDPSQRTRGLLFVAIAAATATVLSASEIWIFENGPGSINLPVSSIQIGADSSRSASPIFAALASDFLGEILATEMRVRLPFVWHTKGDLCRRLATSRLAGLACGTVSCDSFPVRRSDGEHCGVCTSCLLRREALTVAGQEEDRASAQYRFDIYQGLERLPIERSLDALDLVNHVRQLRRLTQGRDGWPSLVAEYPCLAEVAEVLTPVGVGVGLTQRRLVDLYRRYCDEWPGLEQAASGLSVAA